MPTPSWLTPVPPPNASSSDERPEATTALYRIAVEGPGAAHLGLVGAGKLAQLGVVFTSPDDGV